MPVTSTATDAASQADLIARLNAGSSDAKGDKVLSSATEQNDRFLKLLTTQLTNQDPLNPMDNAQMTSQMAQISTVSGLEQLNASMTALSGQFVQLQAMQGASLVGRGVMATGDTLTLRGGVAQGGFEIAAASSQTSVEVLNASGQVVKTVSLGASPAGRHPFTFKANDLAADGAYTFRVVAQSGKTPLDASEMVSDQVKAVNTSGKTLTLELANGKTVPYAAVRVIH
jgi:flagellar basal-body rod modification protein FlgD